MSDRQKITPPSGQMLSPLVRAIVDNEPGLILGPMALKHTLTAYRDDTIVTYVNGQALNFSGGKLAVRKAARGLLHGYIQGHAIPLVACSHDNVSEDTTELISDRSIVKQAWFLMDAGLMPAGFDDVPENAEPYMRQANGM